ncbi:MAG: YggS family pyridoxal phosphate-dependent enzyme [Candidatus Dormibacteraeota bacterium]|nr:YggS family pyridoxal phosphate-dependent enzyme [Candidatus Dormibacteraeota bacterium]
MSGLAARLEAIRERIRLAGGDPGAITIVAVTKGRNEGQCREAVAAGLSALGENRVQEALAKMAGREGQEPLAGVEWHLIGHLQTNKVRVAAGRFALIQSVDSVRLAQALGERDPWQRVLLQVNVSRESEKHGFAPDGVVEAARELASVFRLEGLMGMGPRSGDPSGCFAELAGLVRECRKATGLALPVLSMGMSGDYEAAVRAGSTMLRLGTALFGEQVG